MTETAQIVQLFKNLRDDTSTLVKQEVALAKAEVKEKAVFTSKQVAAIAVGGVIAFAAFITLLYGISNGVTVALVESGLLSADIAVWLAPVLVGVITLLIGGAAITKGVKSLSDADLTPEKTVQSLKDNKNWVERKVQ